MWQSDKALGSVSKMVRSGNRVVFETSGSYIGLRARDGVFVVDMMVAPPGREQKSKPLFFGGGACSSASMSK